MKSLAAINKELYDALRPIFDLPDGCRKVTISFGLHQLPSVELERIVREAGLPTRAMVTRFTLSDPLVLASVGIGEGGDVTTFESTSVAREPKSAA